MVRTVIVVAVILLLAGWGPFLLLPGGELEGPEAPAPADWSFTDNFKTIQFETNPSDPYSVNIWVIQFDGHLYVHAGKNRAAWVEHMEADANVRIRIDGKIYRLSAARVTDQSEFDRFSDTVLANNGQDGKSVHW